MPRKVQPQWGRQGMVRVPGWELTDRELVALQEWLGTTGQPDRGLHHDDEEIRVLAAHPGFPSGSELPDHVRAELDSNREFLIMSRRQKAQMPARRKRNAALAALLKRIAAFQTAIAALTPLPTWPLVDDLETDDLTPSEVFVTLPHRLRVVADMARAASRECARVSNDTDRSTLLRSLAISADELADTLLDDASQGDVLNHLPWGQDYVMNTLPEVVNVSIWLSASAETALQVGRKARGPDKFKELRQAIFWLRRSYEECGGRFTHTPRDKTFYDGSPHSSAGRFVLDSIKMSAPEITPQSISSGMAEVVRKKSKRGENRRGEDLSDRQPSSSRAPDGSRPTC